MTSKCLEDIRDEVLWLTKVPRLHLSQRRLDGLNLSHALRAKFGNALTYWEATLSWLPRELELTPGTYAKVISFLHTKETIFWQAIKDKDALTFDVILIGIVRQNC